MWVYGEIPRLRFFIQPVYSINSKRTYLVSVRSCKILTNFFVDRLAINDGVNAQDNLPWQAFLRISPENSMVNNVMK